MQNLGIIILVVFVGLSCTSRPAEPLAVHTSPMPATTPSSATGSPPVSSKDWTGVYASPNEIGAFSGTVLVLRNIMEEKIYYRMRLYSDVADADAIRQDEATGFCLIDQNVIYIPQAYGHIREGKPDLAARIDRMTLVEINGQKALMRDDALRIFRNENKLYDYGILVKVSDDADSVLDLKTVNHPSIKLLYLDPTKPWSDPFVHGGNGR